MIKASLQAAICDDALFSMKDIRYIALDLDGTLTNEEKAITPVTLQALLDIQQRGVRLILASGRPPYGMRPLARQLRIEEYGGLLLCYNGGHIEEVSTGRILVEQALPDEYLEQLHKWQEESGLTTAHALGNAPVAALTLMSYYEDHIYTEYPDNEYVHQSARNNKMQITKLDDFVREMPRPINKCLMVGDPSIVPEWEARMQKAMEGKMHICRSTPYFIEMLPKGIDKGLALQKLMPRLGLTTDSLMAFGDSFNDIGMLETAGIGIAMANAEEPVKAVADYVTASNEEDGVAVALRHFGLTEI